MSFRALDYVEYDRRPRIGDRVWVTARDLNGRSLASWRGEVITVHNRTKDIRDGTTTRAGRFPDVTVILFHGDMGFVSDASYRPWDSFRVPFKWLRIHKDDG